MKKAVGVLVAAVILLVGLPGSASADLAGTQDFLVVFSGAEGSPGRVIATGAFTGVGTVVTPQGLRVGSQRS